MAPITLETLAQAYALKRRRKPPHSVLGVPKITPAWPRGPRRLGPSGRWVPNSTANQTDARKRYGRLPT